MADGVLAVGLKNTVIAGLFIVVLNVLLQRTLDTEALTPAPAQASVPLPVLESTSPFTPAPVPGPVPVLVQPAPAPAQTSSLGASSAAVPDEMLEYVFGDSTSGSVQAPATPLACDRDPCDPGPPLPQPSLKYRPPVQAPPSESAGQARKRLPVAPNAADCRGNQMICQYNNEDVMCGGALFGGRVGYTGYDSGAAVGLGYPIEGA